MIRNDRSAALLWAEQGEHSVCHQQSSPCRLSPSRKLLSPAAGFIARRRPPLTLPLTSQGDPVPLIELSTDRLQSRTRNEYRGGIAPRGVIANASEPLHNCQGMCDSRRMPGQPGRYISIAKYFHQIVKIICYLFFLMLTKKKTICLFFESNNSQ